MEPNDENVNLSYLEVLPIEIIEIIGSFLDGKGLAACCATSHRLRDVFDCDSIWKKKCDTSLAKYLEETPCKVEPKFTNPEEAETTLSPISHWRLAYMRENHLWNNWRTGNNVEESLVSPVWSPDNFFFPLNCNLYYSNISLWRMSILDEIVLDELSELDELDLEEHIMYLAEICTPKDIAFLDNDVVLVKFDDLLGFFNISKPNYLEVANDISYPFCTHSEFVVVSEYSRVIIIFRNLVEVYIVDLPLKDTTLDRAFLYNEPQELKNLKEPDVISKISSYRERMLPPTKSHHVIVKDLIVFVSEENSNIHVWNIITGAKIRKEESPVQGFCADMKASKSLIILMIYCKYHGKAILAYDVNTLSYLPLKLPTKVVQGAIDFYVVDCFVAISFAKIRSGPISKCLNVYNILTSELNLGNQSIVPSLGCEIVGDSFLFLQKYKLIMYCPSTKRLTRVLHLHKSTQFLPLFKVINSKLILVENSDRMWQLYEVTENSLKKTKLVVNTNNFNRQSIVSTSTRMIVDKVLMKTFW